MVKAALQEQRPSGQPKDKRFLRGNCPRAEQQQALAESPRPQFPCGLLSVFQPTEPGSESWGEMQEETTKLNNRASSASSGRGRLLPWSAQTQGESSPEPASFFKIMLGLEFRVLLHLKSWS